MSVHRHVHRSVRVAAYSAVSALLLSFPSASDAAHVYWTGAQDSNWNNPANWSSGAVPTSADTVYLVTHDQAGTALTNLPSNMDLAGAQLDNVIFTGSTALTVGGNSLTLDRLATRSTRSLTYLNGSDTVTVSSGTGGTAGLQVGMAVPSGNGIQANTTITGIIDANTFRISLPTNAADTGRAKNLEARASLVWNTNLNLANAAENWTVAGSQTLTVNGNISGIGSIANNYGESGGTLDLKGNNTYAGRTVFNTGTLRFYGPQAISPNTTIGLSYNSARFASNSGSGDFAYTVLNQFENDNNAGSIHIGGGGRVTFAGDILEKPTSGVRGLKFFREGSGSAVVELKGNVNQDGPLAVDSPVLVRLHNPITQAFGGNTDIAISTNSSQIDGTLDLMGNSFDRKVSFTNQGGMNGAGNLANSKLSTPATVSGPLINLGTNGGNYEFGGPGAIVVTGDIRVNTGTSTGTGYNKVGPGAAIIRSANFYDVTPANNNVNEVLNGSLVLDNSAANNAKMTGDGLTLANGRLVIVGNASSATTYNVTTLTLSTMDKGFAEVDVRNNGGGAAFNFTTLAGLTDNETLNFQVNRGSSGTSATIGSTQAAGKLAPTITFNRNQWASATGSAIVGSDPDLAAADAATFQTSSGFTQDVDVTGSFATSALTKARTLRFTQAGGNVLTLGANLELNKSGGSGSGIMVTAETGAVTIAGTSSIDIGVNTSLSVHHHGSNPLQIDTRIIGASGAKLNKVGSGELVLANATNNWGYSSASAQAINIYEGTVTLAAMADTGANSPIGTNGVVVIGAKNDVDYSTGVVTQQPARLRYTGTGHNTNRTLQLVGVSEIQANGSGLLRFTNAGDVVTSAANTGNWNDLILSGSGTGQFDGAVKLGLADLVKRGSGTWTLSDTSSLTTYGKLLVEEGTLVNDGAVFMHTDVVVSGSGRLAGSGDYRGQVTITSSGAISPGNSAGILTTGSVELDGTLIAEIMGSSAGTGYDQLAVSGTVTLGGSSNLQLSADYVSEDGAQYVLISNDGVDAIAGTFAKANGLAIIDGQFTANGHLWSLNYAGGDGNDLTAIVAVPEPSVISLTGLAAGAVVLRRRRNA